MAGDDEQLRAIVRAVLDETSQGGATPLPARRRSSIPDLNLGAATVPGSLVAATLRWLIIGGGGLGLLDQVIEARIQATMPEIEALVEAAVDRSLDRALTEE